MRHFFYNDREGTVTPQLCLPSSELMVARSPAILASMANGTGDKLSPMWRDLRGSGLVCKALEENERFETCLCQLSLQGLPRQISGMRALPQWSVPLLGNARPTLPSVPTLNASRTTLDLRAFFPSFFLSFFFSSPPVTFFIKEQTHAISHRYARSISYYFVPSASSVLVTTG